MMPERCHEGAFLFFHIGCRCIHTVYSRSPGNECCHEYALDGYLAIYIYNTYIRFLHIHIAICVPNLVEIAPGLSELCSNIHTHPFYRYRLSVSSSLIDHYSMLLYYYYLWLLLLSLLLLLLL
jgi:hypothetical protein